MWLMSNFESLLFIALVAVMVAVALISGLIVDDRRLC